MEFNKCLEFATQKHNGQVRQGGDEYITHPVAVADILRLKGFDEEYQITALFHDLLEDTDATDVQILELSNINVLEAVRLVTKVKPYVMEEYLYKIKLNKIAYMVKLADRLHNLRCAKYTSEIFIKRYIEETLKHYLEFSKGTVFEEEIKDEVELLENVLLELKK